MTTITLNERDHVYRVDGQIVIGVTDALRDLKDLESVPDENLRVARDRGKKADDAIMLHIDDRLDEEDLDPILSPYLAAWKKAVERYGIRVIHKQLRVYHSIYGYAGTLDVIAEMERRPPHIRGDGLIVIDVKCTDQVGDEVALQLAAYQGAYNHTLDRDLARFKEPRIRHRLVLQLFDTGEFKPHWFTERTDFMSFCCFVGAHKYLLKTGRIKPHDQKD